MISSMDTLMTLAHGSGGMIVAIMVLATAAGFIAGLFFDRSVKRSQDNEK